MRPAGSVLSGYDIAAYAVKTQDEVASALGISRARVQQIEQSGLRKLRAIIEARRAAGAVS